MQPRLFTVGYLQSLAEPNGAWYNANSPRALVGRCLLDMIEYFTTPDLPGRFHDLADAHAIRLSVRCLSDLKLNRREQLRSLTFRLKERLASLRRRRKATAPFYGVDYWDWAAILDCFFETKDKFSVITNDIFHDEMESFYENVKGSLDSGLTVKSEGEWYGPATAVAARRILQKWSSSDGHYNLTHIVKTLEKQALEKIMGGRYRGHKVERALRLWHYGQVVHAFPDNRTAHQHKSIRDLSALLKLDDKAYRAYVLSRVIQGAHAVGDSETQQKATKALYDCQDLERPFGKGLVGDNIKGSLNALEALWPTLIDEDIRQIGGMVDALASAHSRENTVGVLVAIEEELDAVANAFMADNAQEELPSRKTQRTFCQPIYRAVVRLGKGHVDSEDATRKLLTEDMAKWLFMVGVAGSLGTESQTSRTGPQIGDVVLATSLAPHNIREKARDVVESAPVPFRGGLWTIIPTSPSLFSSASKAASEIFSKTNTVTVHEGVVVTSHLTDSPQRKADILEKWPGGLAVEEEGYIFALLCLHDERPYMVIRGIMDFAGGDKKTAQKGGEQARKMNAAKIAAEVVVKAIKHLSKRW